MREPISACLRQHTGLTSIVWRPALDMLREEGCEPAAAANDAPAAAPPAAGAAEAAAAAGQSPAEENGTAAAASTDAGSSSSSVDEVVVVENDVRFMASPHGQKTGWGLVDVCSVFAVRLSAAF
jgi:hypothetical protein